MPLPEGFENYYGILGVPSGADSVKLTAAWITAAVVYHPEQGRERANHYNLIPRLEERYRLLSLAYNVLINRTLRSAYDTFYYTRPYLLTPAAYTAEARKNAFSDLDSDPDYALHFRTMAGHRTAVTRNAAGRVASWFTNFLEGSGAIAIQRLRREEEWVLERIASGAKLVDGVAHDVLLAVGRLKDAENERADRGDVLPAVDSAFGIIRSKLRANGLPRHWDIPVRAGIITPAMHRVDKESEVLRVLFPAAFGDVPSFNSVPPLDLEGQLSTDFKMPEYLRAGLNATLAAQQQADASLMSNIRSFFGGKDKDKDKEKEPKNITVTKTVTITPDEARSTVVSERAGKEGKGKAKEGYDDKFDSITSTRGSLFDMPLHSPMTPHSHSREASSTSRSLLVDSERRKTVLSKIVAVALGDPREVPPRRTISGMPAARSSLDSVGSKSTTETNPPLSRRNTIVNVRSSPARSRVVEQPAPQVLPTSTSVQTTPRLLSEISDQAPSAILAVPGKHITGDQTQEKVPSAAVKHPKQATHPAHPAPSEPSEPSFQASQTLQIVVDKSEAPKKADKVGNAAKEYHAPPSSFLAPPPANLRRSKSEKAKIQKQEPDLGLDKKKLEGKSSGLKSSTSSVAESAPNVSKTVQTKTPTKTSETVIKSLEKVTTKAPDTLTIKTPTPAAESSQKPRPLTHPSTETQIPCPTKHTRHHSLGDVPVPAPAPRPIISKPKISNLTTDTKSSSSNPSGSDSSAKVKLVSLGRPRKAVKKVKAKAKTKDKSTETVPKHTEVPAPKPYDEIGSPAPAFITAFAEQWAASTPRAIAPVFRIVNKAQLPTGSYCRGWGVCFQDDVVWEAWNGPDKRRKFLVRRQLDFNKDAEFIKALVAEETSFSYAPWTAIETGFHSRLTTDIPASDHVTVEWRRGEWGIRMLAEYLEKGWADNETDFESEAESEGDPWDGFERVFPPSPPLTDPEHHVQIAQLQPVEYIHVPETTIEKKKGSFWGRMFGLRKKEPEVGAIQPASPTIRSIFDSGKQRPNLSRSVSEPFVNEYVPVSTSTAQPPSGNSRPRAASDPVTKVTNPATPESSPRTPRRVSRGPAAKLDSLPEDTVIGDETPKTGLLRTRSLGRKTPKSQEDSPKGEERNDRTPNRYTFILEPSSPPSSPTGSPLRSHKYPKLSVGDVLSSHVPVQLSPVTEERESVYSLSLAALSPTPPKTSAPTPSESPAVPADASPSPDRTSWHSVAFGTDFEPTLQAALPPGAEPSALTGRPRPRPKSAPSLDSLRYASIKSIASTVSPRFTQVGPEELSAYSTPNGSPHLAPQALQDSTNRDEDEQEVLEEESDRGVDGAHPFSARYLKVKEGGKENGNAPGAREPDEAPIRSLPKRTSSLPRK